LRGRLPLAHRLQPGAHLVGLGGSRHVRRRSGSSGLLLPFLLGRRLGSQLLLPEALGLCLSFCRGTCSRCLALAERLLFGHTLCSSLCCKLLRPPLPRLLRCSLCGTGGGKLLLLAQPFLLCRCPGRLQRRLLLLKPPLRLGGRFCCTCGLLFLLAPPLGLGSRLGSPCRRLLVPPPLLLLRGLGGASSCLLLLPAPPFLLFRCFGRRCRSLLLPLPPLLLLSHGLGGLRRLQLQLLPPLVCRRSLRSRHLLLPVPRCQGHLQAGAQVGHAGASLLCASTHPRKASGQVR
jgi:hypothetical protein